ncbi:MAG: PAS domain-containing protein [Pseudomonadales bacterium]
MSRHAEHFKALILDDNSSESVLLRQLLASLAGRPFSSDIHHSSQGFFPSGNKHYELIFLADNYAHTDLVQLVSLARAQFTEAAIILCADGDISAQELVAATHSGLNQVIDKDTLSRSVLETTIGAINWEQTGERGSNSTSHPHQNLSRPPSIDRKPLVTPAAALPDTTLTEMAKSSTADLTRSFGPELEFLSTGIVVLEQRNESWIIRSINAAAAELENLDPAALLGSSWSEAPISYQNLDLFSELEELLAGEQIRFTDVLRVDEEGHASWRNIIAKRGSEQQLILELHESAFHSDGDVADMAKDDSTQTIWRHIVSSYPDLSALVDEDGSIVELVSGDWGKIQNKPETLKGQTLSSLLNDQQRPLYREMLSKALNTGKPQQTVFMLELSDGPMWLHSTLSLLRTPAASQRTALLVASDVTEMYEQQVAKFAELETMKEFSRRVPFALAIKDSDGRFERANPYFLDLFGLRSDDVIGKAETDLFPEHLIQQLQDMETQMLRTQDVVEASVQVDPDDWMVYRFIKLPLHNELDNNLASCLLVLPSDGEDPIAMTIAANKNQAKKPNQAQAATDIKSDSKKKSPRLKTNKP